MLEKIFHLKESGTNVKTELIAGLTTFTTMAYILAVNPITLSACGMDFERQKEYMLERFMISPYAMNATEHLYSELNMIIQEIKFLS